MSHLIQPRHKNCIVIAMHGMPPSNFPKEDLRMLISLEKKMEHNKETISEDEKNLFVKLDTTIRSIERNINNDPFFVHSYQLARLLQERLDMPVFVGFNEFCNPTILNVIDTCILSGIQKITVVTPMMIRGGSHSEKDIPDIVQEAQKKYPNITITYAWPFDTHHIADFLKMHIQKFNS